MPESEDLYKRQRVPMSGHVAESETARKLQNAISIFQVHK